MLPVHEIEGAFALPQVLETLRDHLVPNSEPKKWIEDLLNNVTNVFHNNLSRFAHAQTIRNLRWTVGAPIPVSQPPSSKEEGIAGIQQLLVEMKRKLDCIDFSREYSDLAGVLESGDFEKIIATFPSKDVKQLISKHLGKKDFSSLVSFVLAALHSYQSGDTSASHYLLGHKLTDALRNHHFPTNVDNL